VKTYSFRLTQGQDLRQEIETFLHEKDIAAAVILSGVGGLSRINLRLADPRKFLTRELDVEIVSVTGTLSKNGSHLHLSVSDEAGVTYGGHLSKGNVVRLTVEIVIGLIEATYERKPDETTGYDELTIIEA